MQCKLYTEIGPDILFELLYRISYNKYRALKTVQLWESKLKHEPPSNKRLSSNKHCSSKRGASSKYYTF